MADLTISEDPSALDSDEEGIECDCEVGLLVKQLSWKLDSRFFPSKVGFKPAWLALNESIPDFTALSCTLCKSPLMFLCQIYNAIDDKETCFHRMLYVFVCVTENCVGERSNEGFKVFRCQLGRVNSFYPDTAPVEKETWRRDICAESFGIKLCHVCGIQSKSRCAGCESVFYCCKQHQIFDWKDGHKNVCKKGLLDHRKSTMLFEESEIVTEPEVISDDEEDTNDNAVDAIEGSLQNVECEHELEKMALSKADETFMKFTKRMQHAPSQVIRYKRNGVPLWISNKNIPSVDDDIPNCQYCGGKRIFEFQVMPQLLNFLGVDQRASSLDWGVLVIFTCENSCEDGPDYKLEYLYKQDITNDAGNI